MSAGRNEKQKVKIRRKKMWAPLRKLFAPPSVPSWLRAWFRLEQDSQPGVLAPPRGTRLNIKGYEDPWVTEQLIYLL